VLNGRCDNMHRNSRWLGPIPHSHGIKVVAAAATYYLTAFSAVLALPWNKVPLQSQETTS